MTISSIIISIISNAGNYLGQIRNKKLNKFSTYLVQDKNEKRIMKVRLKSTSKRWLGNEMMFTVHEDFLRQYFRCQSLTINAESTNFINKKFTIIDNESSDSGLFIFKHT